MLRARSKRMTQRPYWCQRRCYEVRAARSLRCLHFVEETRSNLGGAVQKRGGT
jgi:hypothetical protein